MADLNTDVRYIKGVGEAKAKALGKLGIATLGDLIAWFPHRYEDRRETKPVSQLIPPRWRNWAARRRISLPWWRTREMIQDRTTRPRRTKKIISPRL